VVLLIVHALLTTPAHAATTGREATICGAIKERLVFWLWSRVAPKPNASRHASNPLIEAIHFTSGDGKKLSGYRFLAHDGELKPLRAQGYILLALGNAMIADQMIGELSEYARAGYDAYVFDYRGYGHSEGKRRIGAIIEDYVEIVTDLNTKYERALLYGVSLGGIVIMNVVGAGIAFNAAVIDSSPSRLSDKGCPARIDPVGHLSEPVAPKLMVITGKRDQVLGPEETREFREKAAAMGAQTIDDEAFAHPYMDQSWNTHLRRTQLVRDYFLRQVGTHWR
jgi:alpha/beta superfamily hydrolase